MPVYSPVITEIGTKTYHINEFGLASMYLIVGKQRALLIDTGVGCFNLKALVRRVTPLPYDVVLTHGHVGHASGARQFKHIYLHPDDYQLAHLVDLAARKKFVNLPRIREEGNIFACNESSTVDFTVKPEISELYDGLCFDLGGRMVQCITTPGHTWGSCSFIDNLSRIIFTGDSCGKVLFINCAVSTMLRGLFNMRIHMDNFDQIYGGHVNYITTAVTRSTRSKTLIDCISACRCIIEIGKQDTSNNNYNIKDIYGKEHPLYEIGTTKVVFDPEKPWEPEEGHALVPIGI